MKEINSSSLTQVARNQINSNFDELAEAIINPLYTALIIPTSPAGLPVGAIWNQGGVLTLVVADLEEQVLTVGGEVLTVGGETIVIWSD